MSGKPDYRNYVNPGPKGSRFTANWQLEFLPDGETYTEDKSGKIVEALIDSGRRGSIVRVRRLFCLAPWGKSPKMGPAKRRSVLADRVQRIIDAGGSIMEGETGRCTKERGGCAKMLMGGYDDIASSGRGIAKGRTGRPPVYEFTAAEWEIMGGIWMSRKHPNDPARMAAIKRRLGKCPGRTTLRNKFGSPHKGRNGS